MRPANHRPHRCFFTRFHEILAEPLGLCPSVTGRSHPVAALGGDASHAAMSYALKVFQLRLTQAHYLSFHPRSQRFNGVVIRSFPAAWSG